MNESITNEHSVVSAREDCLAAYTLSSMYRNPCPESHAEAMRVYDAQVWLEADRTKLEKSVDFSPHDTERRIELSQVTGKRKHMDLAYSGNVDLTPEARPQADRINPNGETVAERMMPEAVGDRPGTGSDDANTSRRLCREDQQKSSDIQAMGDAPEPDANARGMERRRDITPTTSTRMRLRGVTNDSMARPQTDQRRMNTTALQAPQDQQAVGHEVSDKLTSMLKVRD
eukprot:gene7540-15444_t